MMVRETIALASEIHTKHGNTICTENVDFLKVKPFDASSNRWTFNCYDGHEFETFFLLPFDC